MSVYVGAAQCPAAKRELVRDGGRAGDVRVRVICLADVESGSRVDLATVGADARRATEDSTSVGYIEAPGPGTRFSQPILEEAGIAWIYNSSGTAAMGRLLHAIGDADTSSLRDSVREALDQA